MSPLSHYLAYCKKAVSIAILFSSLLSSALGDQARAAAANSPVNSTVNISGLPDTGNYTMASSNDRAAGQPFTVSRSASITIPPGTYSQVIAAPGVSFGDRNKITFGKGTVILQGGANTDLIFPLSTEKDRTQAQIQINPNGGNATLVLEQGNVTGNIYMYPHSPYQGRLLIGTVPGDSTNGAVNITGNIGSNVGAAASPELAMVQTNGADLNITGIISRIGILEANKGNINIKRTGTSCFDVAPNVISLQPGTSITSDGWIHTNTLQLRDNAILYNTGPYGAGQRGRIDIVQGPIDGTEANGIMGKNSQIKSEDDTISFFKGVDSGSGEIRAGANIATFSTYQPPRTAEAMAGNLKQASADAPLTVVATGVSASSQTIGNIYAGDIDVKSAIAGGQNLAAGSVALQYDADPARIHLQNTFTSTQFYPRGTITAQELKAVNGLISAGEINVSAGTEPGLEARNLLAVRQPALGDLPASTGNVNLENTAFKLTGETGLDKIGELAGGDILPYAAQIEGDLASRNNGSSSFTSILVKGNATVSGGTLTGNTLMVGTETNGQEDNGNLNFTNLNTTTITDKLTVANDLSMTGPASRSINIAQVGQTAQITDGVYTGASLTAADSITFTDVKRVDLTDTLEATSGDITITGNKSANINNIYAGKDLSVTDGKLQATQITTAAGNASLTNVTDFTVNDIASVNGDLIASGNGSSIFKNKLEVKGLLDYSGGIFKASDMTVAEAKFTDVSTINVDMARITKGDLAATGNGNAAFGDLNVNGSLSFGGGTFKADALTTGGSASFENVASISSAESATIGGNLKITGNQAASFNIIDIAGSTNVTGGTFKATKLTTGDAASQNGDFTVTNGSFDLGTGSIIHGKLDASGNQASTIGNITVDKSVSIAGGALEGGRLKAESAAFTDHIKVYLDYLDLSDPATSLVIDDGSVVTVKNISTPVGADNIQGTLIIEGNLEDFQDLGDINLADGDLEGSPNTALLSFGNITGTGKGASMDDITAYQITADNIDINDANIKLVGMGIYGSEVNNNLIITQNGDTSFGDLQVGQNVAIEGGNVEGRKLTVGGNASFSDVELDLLGNGANASEITGALTITDNTKSSLGDLTVGGVLSAAGGQIGGGKLTAQANAAFTSVSLIVDELTAQQDLQLKDNGETVISKLNVTGSLTGESGSLSLSEVDVAGDAVLSNMDLAIQNNINNIAHIGGTLKLDPNGSSKLGFVNIDGNLEASGGNVAANCLKVGGDASFSSVEVLLNTTQDLQAEITGNLSLNENKSASLGFIKVGKNITGTGGKVTASGLEAGQDVSFSNTEITLNTRADNPGNIAGNFSLTDNVAANLGYLTVGQRASIKGGTASGIKLSANDARFAEVNASFEEIDVSGVGEFQNGNLTAAKIGGNDLIFRDGVKAALDEIILNGNEKRIFVGMSGDAIGNTTLSVGSLDLRQGSLTVGNIGAAPATAAISQFANGSSQGNIINGNVAVGPNGRLILGTRDLGWASVNIADAKAALGVAQPMRLAAGMGMAVSGDANVVPIANQIKFDSSSLFIIDAASTRVYYLGDAVPTTEVVSSKKTPGAISADTGTLQAAIALGSKIHIRNPRPNTVIVALGENIQTNYADQSARTGRADNNDAAVANAPWANANLTYDNADSVVITRLTGEYAGQFSVLPINDPGTNPPTTPDQPVTPPDNPSPDQPSQPGNPEQPDQPGGTDTPAQPETPGEPDTPGQPDTPNNPDEPSPEEPDPETPDVPENPAAPVIPVEQPKEPGEQFIHDVTTVFDERPHKAQQTLNSSSHMVTTGGVPVLVKAANDAASGAILQRARIIDILADEEELRGKSFALWALPIYNSVAGYGLEGGSGDYGYFGGLGGVIIGADWTWAKQLRFGLDFNIGGGYLKSNGDLAQTENSMSFWGLGAYTGYRVDNFGIQAEVGLTSSYNKVKQDLPDDLHWSELKADIMATAVSAGLRAEYRFLNDFLDIVPHAGVRYLNLHTLSYDINSSGHGTILEGSGFYQNIWTFPLGIYMGKAFQLDNGLQILPSIDFTVIPAAGDLDSKSRVWYTGAPQELDLRADFMDSVTYGGSAGVEVKAGDFTLGINYTGQFGEHTQSNAVFGILRYEF